ncbi:MAG: hypothetical protein GXY70_07425 [Euryarchaeota archaeon]|nr:hypothetical protein [Euryarchaeota archaeon]
MQGRGQEAVIMVLTRAIRDWLASLPRDREFSLEWAYNRLLDDYPRYAVDRSRASRAINQTKLFDTWKDGKVRMFKYRGKA